MVRKQKLPENCGDGKGCCWEISWAWGVRNKEADPWEKPYL